MNEIQWWGYKHQNGTIQVKRFFDGRDIQEAEESPFCQRAVGPFNCEGREQALEIAGKLLGNKEPNGDNNKPDWDGKCENCGESPIVPSTGMCGPCTFGEADTVNGNW